MRMWNRRVGGVLAVLLGCVLAWPVWAEEGAGSMTEARAAELHVLLTPPTDALWRTIPWMTSVLEAQRVAVERGKPVFIWAMDGHPLGCV